MLLMEGSALFFPIIHQHHGISQAFIFGSQYTRLVYGDKRNKMVAQNAAEETKRIFLVLDL